MAKKTKGNGKRILTYAELFGINGDYNIDHDFLDLELKCVDERVTVFGMGHNLEQTAGSCQMIVMRPGDMILIDKTTYEILYIPNLKHKN